MSGPVFVSMPKEAVCGEPSGTAIVENETKQWLTPGAYIAQAVCMRQEVRLVMERLEADRYSVFVVLDDDPEDILDEIIDAEHELYSTFRWLPFDIRIMKPSSTWSAQDLLRDALVRYSRIQPHGNR